MGHKPKEQVGDTFRLSIQRPAHQGKAVGFAPSGVVVLVAGGVVGDTLEVEVARVAKRHLEARIVRVLSPSPHRIPPRCAAAAHGAGCCDFSHLDPDYELEVKATILRSHLERMGKLETIAPIDIVELAREHWRCRFRLGIDSSGRLGQRAPRSHKIITEQCLQYPEVLSVEVARWQREPQPQHVGKELLCAIDDQGNLHTELHLAAQRAPRRHQAQHARRSTPAPAPSRRPDSTQHYVVGGHTFDVTIDGFWQAHRDAAATYHDIIRQWLENINNNDAAENSQLCAWDLYGGVGLFIPVLQQCGYGQIYSVESAPVVDSFNQPNVEFVTSAVERWVSSERAVQAPPHVVIADPPRSGAGAAVIEGIAKQQPQLVVHIGCDPVAFARDIGLWSSHGYVPTKITIVNAFPGTHHFETLALLQPRQNTHN